MEIKYYTRISNILRIMEMKTLIDIHSVIYSMFMKYTFIAMEQAGRCGNKEA